MSSTLHIIKQNDLLPVHRATLLDANNQPINLSGATLKFHMKGRNSTQVKVDAAAVIVDAVAGKVEYRWAPGDTSQIGAFDAEYQITYPGAKPLTVPNDGYMTVQIVAEIA